MYTRRRLLASGICGSLLFVGGCSQPEDDSPTTDDDDPSDRDSPEQLEPSGEDKETDDDDSVDVKIATFDADVDVEYPEPIRVDDYITVHISVINTGTKSGSYDKEFWMAKSKDDDGKIKSITGELSPKESKKHERKFSFSQPGEYTLWLGKTELYTVLVRPQRRTPSPEPTPDPSPEVDVGGEANISFTEESGSEYSET